MALAGWDFVNSGLHDLGTNLDPPTSYTNQNPLFCRVPINSMYGFVVGTYKIVGLGEFR